MVEGVALTGGVLVGGGIGVDAGFANVGWMGKTANRPMPVSGSKAEARKIALPALGKQALPYARVTANVDKQRS